MMQSLTQTLVDGLVSILTDTLFPLMFIGFALAAFGKLLVYVTVSRQWWFVRELDKRAHSFLRAKDSREASSYYVGVKRLLERTYYELFKVRAVMMRRKIDYITSPVDRLFAVQQGCARVIEDTLQESRFLKRSEVPNFTEISRASSRNNPAFSKVMGWIPVGSMNDVLNLMPGLFIIGGIFGTFLGIMEALPELSQMNLDDAEGAKLIMDTFLLKISFSISTSVVGILFSVILTMFYTLLSPDKLFVRVVDTYARVLARIWDASSSNDIPDDLAAFDQHRDPLEALAEMALKDDQRIPDKKAS